jgi:hypothetical protein
VIERSGSKIMFFNLNKFKVCLSLVIISFDSFADILARNKENPVNLPAPHPK